jgi:peptidoglycan L-alanyl-D-glutamate endopeptidase CwlK
MILNKRSLEKLSKCHEDLKKIFIKAADNSPYKFVITSGYRSPEEQNLLYQQGRTKPGEIVTYKDGYEKKSKHNNLPSDAVDVAIILDGKLNWDPKHYLKLAEHILDVSDSLFLSKEISKQIECGAYWETFKDYPHYER